MPAFLAVLNAVPPHFVDSKQHRLRNTILEILSRLPTTDVFKPYAANVHHMVLNLIPQDNEDNVIVCLRILLDLHRSYRPQFESEAAKFFEIVQRVYAELQSAVLKAFGGPDGTPPATSPVVQQGDGQVQLKPLARGIESFKVLAECPIIVVSLFQLYSSPTPSLKDHVSAFIPLIVKV